MHLQLLRAEIEDVEIEAEEEVWRNLEEEGLNETPEIPKLGEISKEDAQFIAEPTHRVRTDENGDRRPTSLM